MCSITKRWWIYLICTVVKILIMGTGPCKMFTSWEWGWKRLKRVDSNLQHLRLSMTKRWDIHRISIVVKMNQGRGWKSQIGMVSKMGLNFPNDSSLRLHVDLCRERRHSLWLNHWSSTTDIDFNWSSTSADRLRIRFTNLNSSLVDSELIQDWTEKYKMYLISFLGNSKLLMLL